VLEGIMQYRSSPLDKIAAAGKMHGDNNQAIANTYWWPLRFARDHHIEPLVCRAAVRVPLARPVRTSLAALASLTAIPASPHQLDCRITSTSALQQRWTVPPDTRIRALRIPVFQRTTNVGPEDQDPIMNAGLNVRVGLPSGQSVSATFPPGSISWAPRSILVNLPTTLRTGGIIKVSLTTKATNGCYGVMVGTATATLASGIYTALEGAAHDAPGAQLVLAT